MYEYLRVPAAPHPTDLNPLIWKRGGAGYISLVRGSREQPARPYCGYRLGYPCAGLELSKHAG